MSKSSRTRVMPAAEFRVRFFELLDEIATENKETIITKKGKPLAKVIPYHEEKEVIWGCMENTLEIRGDLLEPVLPPFPEWGKNEE